MSEDGAEKTLQRRFMEGVFTLAVTSGKDASELIEDCSMQFSELFGGNETVRELTYVVTASAILEVAQTLFHVGKGISAFNMTGFQLSQITKKIDKVSENVDKILKEPIMTAVASLDTAINKIDSELYAEAMEDLKGVEKEALKALNYAKQACAGKNVHLSNYKELVKAVKILLYTKIMRNSFDENTQIFLPYYLLEAKKRQFIEKEVKKLAETCVDIMQTVNVKKFKWTRLREVF